MKSTSPARARGALLKSCLAAGALCATAHAATAATLLEYWDFNNTYSNYSNPSLGVFATPTQNGTANNGEIYNPGTRLFSSNAGSFTGGPVYSNGSIDLNGVKGTPNYGNVTSTGWGAFSDSGNKAPNDPTSGGSLIMIDADKSVANNPSLVFNLDSAGYSDLTLSMYARKAGGVTAAPGLTWYSSTDGGTTWTPLSGFTLQSGSNGAGAFVYYSFNLDSSFDNLGNFAIRMDIDLSGANTGTSFAIDDVQLNALSAVPEPSTCALLGLGGLALLLRRRRSQG